jgi:hypothetical protein
MRIALLATLIVAGAAIPARAQLVAARDGPIVYGHHPDVTSCRTRFWVDALGVSVKIGTSPAEVVRFRTCSCPTERPRAAGRRGHNGQSCRVRDARHPGPWAG